MHISHTKSFNKPVLIALTTLAHMINVYEICLNTTTLSDIQYARFQILPVDLHSGQFWSAGIPTMLMGYHNIPIYRHYYHTVI